MEENNKNSSLITKSENKKDSSFASESDSLNDWLPITKSRNAKWWYSAFHNVTAMVGAGILGLPFACSNLGWGPGVTIMLLSWLITFYTLWQMIELHEVVPGKRFDRYHELGQHAFGEKLGLWIVVPLQLSCEVGLCIIYMVTGGNSMKKIYTILCPNGPDIRRTYFILVFGFFNFCLSHLPSFNSITAISFIAAVMSLSYSVIAWGASLHKGVQPSVSYGPRHTSTTDIMFDFFSGLGDTAFAFAGHNVVLEIQATIPSTPGKPSTKPMWKGAFVAYLVVAACYFPVAFIGYWVFGNQVDDNILLSLEKPAGLIVAANLFVVIHVIGSYQVFIMPVFDMLESFLLKSIKLTPSYTLRFVTRSSCVCKSAFSSILNLMFVLFTMFMGIMFPFFGGLLSFFGGFCFAPTSYYIPCFIWLKMVKPRRYSLSWFLNMACIFVGVILTILGPIGGARSLFQSYKTFKLFS